MKINDFNKLYITELQELRSVEDQMARELKGLASQATSPTLAAAVRKHQGETEDHRQQLDDLLSAHDGQTERHSDASMRAMVNEAKKWADMVPDDGLRDAGLIASLQRMEHYEIAVFGTLASWARKLGHTKDANVLSKILDADRRTDVELTKLAEETINPAAAI